MDVHYVSWTKPIRENELSGRSVQLDEANAVIYPSHFRPKMNFANCIFVLHDTGVRVRKQHREVMPDTAVRLRDMIAAALEADEEAFLADASYGQLCCAACEQSATHGPLRRCCFCLLEWHAGCTEQLAQTAPEYLDSSGLVALANGEMQIDDLPFFVLSWPELLACQAVFGLAAVSGFLHACCRRTRQEVNFMSEVLETHSPQPRRIRAGDIFSALLGRVSCCMHDLRPSCSL